MKSTFLQHLNSGALTCPTVVSIALVSMNREILVSIEFVIHNTFKTIRENLLQFDNPYSESAALSFPFLNILLCVIFRIVTRPFSSSSAATLSLNARTPAEGSFTVLQKFLLFVELVLVIVILLMV